MWKKHEQQMPGASWALRVAIATLLWGCAGSEAPGMKTGDPEPAAASGAGLTDPDQPLDMALPDHRVPVPVLPGNEAPPYVLRAPIAMSPSCDPNALALTWPLHGAEGRDWVVQNWVDDDQTAGAIQDFMRNTGSLASTYDNHRGIDISTPSFAETDNDTALVFAAAPGIVEAIGQSNADRNSACLDDAWNYVYVRHANGYLLMYGHIKKNSVRVYVGDTVNTGDVLATVASAGCSTNQHLHFEVHDCSGTPVDTMLHASGPGVNGVAFLPKNPWTNAPPYYGTPGVLTIRTNAKSYPSWYQLIEPRTDQEVFKPGSQLFLGIGSAQMGTNVNGPGVTAPPRGADTMGITIRKPNGTVFATTTWTPGSGARYGFAFTIWGWTLSNDPGRWSIETTMNGASSKTRFFVVADADQLVTNLGEQVVVTQLPETYVQFVLNDFRAIARRPTRMDGFDVGGATYFNLMFRSVEDTSPGIPVAWDAELGLDGSQYQTVFNTQTGLGRRLVSVDAYVSAGNLRYASVFSSEPGPSWFAAHGQTGAQQAATQSGLSPGWRPAIVSAATVGGTTFYASMYINDPGVSWSPGRDLSYADYQTQFNTNGGQGRFPAYLDAYFDAGGTPRINAIFMSPSGGGVWGWHGATGRQNLSNGRRAANAGMIAETLAGVSNGGTTNIAAIWQQPTLLFAPAGPIAGRDCLSVNEPSDASGTWSDNYMCADRIQDMQLRWHTAGVGGLPNPTLQTCTQIIEPSDPDTWTDNFLCKPNANVLQLLWSSSGPQTRNELLCSQWYEPNDLADGWDNNYLCYGTVPNNDSCSDAIELPMESGAMTLTLSTDRATNSAPLTCFGNTSSPDVFFKFTLPSTQTVAIDTFGSNFDTMLGIGTSCGSAPTFCNDDSGSGLQSSITQVLSAGTYYVVVEGFGSNHGDVTLHVNHF